MILLMREWLAGKLILLAIDIAPENLKYAIAKAVLISCKEHQIYLEGLK